MKRYSTSIDFKFWIQKRATGAIAISAFVVTVLSCFPVHAQQMAFSSYERTIIYSVINHFKRECSHVSALDGAKIKEIQGHFQSKKAEMNEDLKKCYGEFLSQMVGTHNIHKQTCDEVTPERKVRRDRDLARLFVNVRKYEYGIKSYHERLNECLIRKGANTKDLVPFSDYEKNARTLSKKIREVDLSQPFKENSVNYR